MEEWKTIEFGSRYSISNEGNVISRVYGKERYLHPVKDKSGYCFIRIKRKAYRVHRLVALAFIDTDNKSLQIDHIDGDKLNNKVSNLRWCTQKENNNNPITRARLSKALLGKKRTEEQRKRMSEAQQKAKPRLGKHFSKETLEKFKNRITHKRSVIMLDKHSEKALKIYNTIKEAAKDVGINSSNISSCCRNKLKTCGGYKWKYFD